MQVARKRKPQLYTLVTVSVNPDVTPESSQGTRRRRVSRRSVVQAKTARTLLRCTRKLTVFKKKMAQLGSVKNKKEREALLHEANALLVDMAMPPLRRIRKSR